MKPYPNSQFFNCIVLIKVINIIKDKDNYQGPLIQSGDQVRRYQLKSLRIILDTYYLDLIQLVEYRCFHNHQ